MQITHEERLKFLKAYNDLRDILLNINECHDIWVSDVRKLEQLEYLMHDVMKFVPDKDEEGRTIHYADWVLSADDDDSDK